MADPLRTMSAFPTKADIAERDRDGRFGSGTDIVAPAINVRYSPESGHLKTAAGDRQSKKNRPLHVRLGPFFCEAF